MLAVPMLTPVTRPEAFTVATEVFELVHVPPASPVDVYCAVLPLHMGEVPLTVPAFAFGLTVSVLKDEKGALHPEVTV